MMGYSIIKHYRSISTLILSLLLTIIITQTTSQSSPQDFIHQHNIARANVGVQGLKWSYRLQRYAERYAHQRIRDCKLVHSTGPYGENLFWGVGAEFDAEDAVKSWVTEKEFYDYDSNECEEGEECGHYTQVVWSGSSRVGCARIRCDDREGIFIICSYDPAGNVDGERPY